MKKRLPAITFVLVLSLTVATWAAKAKTTEFSATLTGSGEVPPVKSMTKGEATFVVSPDGKTISYKMVISNIKNPTMAHIHMGATGKTAPWRSNSTLYRALLRPARSRKGRLPQKTWLDQCRARPSPPS